MYNLKQIPKKKNPQTKRWRWTQCLTESTLTLLLHCLNACIAVGPCRGPLAFHGIAGDLTGQDGWRTTRRKGEGRWGCQRGWWNEEKRGAFSGPKPLESDLNWNLFCSSGRQNKSWSVFKLIADFNWNKNKKLEDIASSYFQHKTYIHWIKTPLGSWWW